jgi:hypothetical protein
VILIAEKNIKRGIKMKKLQTTRSGILKYLKSGHVLSDSIAHEIFGTFSLAQHINVLRDNGNDIRTTMRTNRNTGTRYAEYSMKVRSK